MMLTRVGDRWVIDLGDVQDVPKSEADLLHDVAAATRAAYETYLRSGCASGKLHVQVSLKARKDPETKAWHEGHAPQVKKGA